MRSRRRALPGHRGADTGMWRPDPGAPRHLQDVQLDSRVRHPGQGCVAQTVTHQPSRAELGNQCVPPGRVAEGSVGDHAAARTDDQALIASSTGSQPD